LSFLNPRLSAEEVKKEVDIITVLEYLGAMIEANDAYYIDPLADVSVYCPFCEDRDSKKPAGRVNGMKQLYYCFSCGAGGDAIALIQDYGGMDLKFPELLEWMMDEFG
jgi:DNA primase